MTQQIDILFADVKGDLLVVGGDLVLGDATKQHQYDIIKAGKGHYHHAPSLGVGVDEYLLDEASLPGLEASIRVELERDGLDVDLVELQADGTINVQAVYP